MRCVRVREGEGLEKLSVETCDDPGQPGAGEIRVRIHANSLNFHDFAVCSGRMQADDGRIPMSDGAGIVEAVGEGVSEFAKGDAVLSVFFPDWQKDRATATGFGRTPGDGIDGFAREVVVAPATHFTRQPKGWSHEESATLPTAALTAWRALVVEGGLKPGDTVLTMGTGGVSIFALQMAKAMGATVVATSSSKEKLDRLREMGASELINYKEDEDWGHTVTKLTGGRGADVVVEIGGAGTLPNSINAVAIGGRIVMIGVLTGASGEVPTAALSGKQATVHGVTVGSRQHQIEMIEGLEATGIKPIVDRTFDLADLKAAFEYEKSGQHFGKICTSF
ncbi:zinc-dependent alcohol dehydrogenase family protein [Parvularcula dongshanensis]|uniref:NADPH:quinone reductase-like Zn-dependent oxidoreductase n=1 Tax=Parvularcula dongshanensis TaxID=1173995 RepID=A0A840I528_9PROT|nr:NAD(P)-dependent alcohol dehydrogenase [Parvularcula dongshanensis]MBB4660066.1 NADPH:quinone reductase-like Zn-dependent oxidoreductase [Parvularcula dongshanensis]